MNDKKRKAIEELNKRLLSEGVGSDRLTEYLQPLVDQEVIDSDVMEDILWIVSRNFVEK